MTNPATPIFPTTRTGSRCAVHRLNQPMYVRKREPSRSNHRCPDIDGSSTSPGQNGTPSVPVESQASSLLVILHYLLKNNSTFMGLGWCRCNCPSATGSIRARAGRVLAGGGDNG